MKRWSIVLAALVSAAGEERAVRLRQDTPVELRLMEALSSAESRAGQAVQFEVIEPVAVDGVIVVVRGAKATGTITEASPRGRMGRNGKLSLRVESLCLADGSRGSLHALRDVDRERWGSMQSEPSLGDTVMAIPAAPLLLFVQGKDIAIPRGREVTAYIAEDTTVSASRKPCEEATRAEASAVQAAVEAATVNIASDPAGADIYVDGKFAGNTPSVLRMSEGDHRILIRRNGSKTWERTLSVSGGDIRVNAVLDDASRQVVIGPSPQVSAIQENRYGRRQ